MSRKLVGGLVGATLAFALAACGSTQAASAPTTAPPSSASSTSSSSDSAPATETARPKPTEVRIPKIGAQSTLIEAGLDENQAIQVPPVQQPMQAAWYSYSPVPGEPGPSILLGHVDGNKKPGIFYRLHELKIGDEVFVKRADGKELRFVATRTEQVPKEQFPEDAVYDPTDEPELRLITCGGAFDKAAHSYKDNIIVYARLAP
jgi:sortase (surface protein transpeptidase)